MVLFNHILYKHMCLTSKVNLTKRFYEKYKLMRLITRLYGILLSEIVISLIVVISLVDSHCMVMTGVLHVSEPVSPLILGQSEHNQNMPISLF